jgi:hypothetical protein
MSAHDSQSPQPAQPANNRAAERGSAYLFVLLVLFVLTVLGLSLAIVTQTEVQIGGAQKSATRVLFGGDAGTEIQLAGVMVNLSAPKARYDLGIVTALDDNVETSPMLSTHEAACNLCEVNVGDNRYVVSNFVVNGEGRRLGQGGAVVQANKLISTMYMVQPIAKPSVEEARITFDSALAADVTASPGLDVIRY